MKKIAILGCTGSIGTQSIDVVRQMKTHKVAVLAAQSNADLVLRQAWELMPELVAMEDEAAAQKIKNRLPECTKLIGGKGACVKAAGFDGADVVINAVSGFAGTMPLVAALEKGKRVALANKESIVCAHWLVEKAKAAGKGEIIPVDSEQSAIFQCLGGKGTADVKRLILTASGGPFRQCSAAQLAAVTPEMAAHHPTWNMGKKITIDSATLFNKGLEVMEAAYLFGVSGEKIKVLVHPQSIVHSMVEFNDSAIIAQLSAPDMRLAIHYALTYPVRECSKMGAIDLAKAAALTFEEVDEARFKAIPLAYAALKAGQAMPVVYNAANEAAVELFVKGEIGFLGITERVEHALEKIENRHIATAEEMLFVDGLARRTVREY